MVASTHSKAWRKDSIATHSTISSNFDLIVNCTGLGARYLDGCLPDGGDTEVYPIRGLRVVVRPPTNSTPLMFRETYKRASTNTSGIVSSEKSTRASVENVRWDDRQEEMTFGEGAVYGDDAW